MKTVQERRDEATARGLCRQLCGRKAAKDRKQCTECCEKNVRRKKLDRVKARVAKGDYSTIPGNLIWLAELGLYP